MSLKDYEGCTTTVEIIDGWKVRIYRNKNGVEFRRFRFQPVGFVRVIEPKATDDMTAYHREY